MYPGLGVAPVVATILVKAASAIFNDIKGLFQGSSYDATHQAILQWSQTILNDPTLATSAGQQAWSRLRCWAGDQSVITAANRAYLFGGGNPAQGCGCEVDHGCRADAQRAVATLEANIPSLRTGVLSSDPYPGEPYGGRLAPGTVFTILPGPGTIDTQPPGGVQIGLPVPGSTLLTGQIYGIPIWAIGGGLLWFALSSQRGRA